MEKTNKKNPQDLQDKKDLEIKEQQPSDLPEEEGAQEENNGPQTDDPVYQATQQAESLQKKLDETNDKFLRLFSEFDNFRKRAGKERIELINTASEGVIVSLLPVLDDLERAAQMASRQEDGNGEGIVLIYNKFKNILRQKGVEEIPSAGEPFNTDFHEAITHIPAPDKKSKGKVVEEIQKGYTLNGKVIRYARVVVAN